MPDVFFIGDTHFGHKNILQFYPELRPGKDIEEHDEILVQRWNSVVKKDDVVWHLGDFGICGTDRIARIAPRLLGHKKLVLGNHDKAHTLYSWFRLYGVAMFEHHILTHVPVHTRNVAYKGDVDSRNIHGHLHAKRVMVYPDDFALETDPYQDNRYWNVSCEQINCTPIEYSELRKKYA